MRSETIEGYRLSPQQKQMWALQSNNPQTSFRVMTAVLINGSFYLAEMINALKGVYRRYEILRTSFHHLPGMTIPIQVINDTADLSIEIVDLSGLTAKQQRSKIDALFKETRQKPCDYSRGKLFDVMIIARAPHQHILSLSLPAICADHISLGNLTREIGHCYTAILGRSEIHHDPLQYADIAEWQNELFDAEGALVGRQYWDSRDYSGISTLRLPSTSRPVGQSNFTPKSIVTKIDRNRVKRIKNLAANCRTTAPVFLSTCWHLLLHYLTGQEEILVGTSFKRRNYLELKDAVGLFEGYLPIHSRMNVMTAFIDLLAEVASATEQAEQYQECCFLENIAPAQNDSAGPIYFPFKFEFIAWPEKFSAAGAEFSTLRQYSCACVFDTKLTCYDRPNSLITEFYYHPALISADDMGRFADQYHTLLAHVLDRPESLARELNLLGVSERKQVLTEFSGTAEQALHQERVDQVFTAQSELTPDRIAVICENNHLSFQEANARANQLAHYLRSRGVGPEALVGLLMNRSIEMIVSMIGTLKAGGAYVPFDPDLPRERLAFMLEGARPLLLLSEQNFMGTLPASATRVACIETEREGIDKCSRENIDTKADPANLLYILYTSGSTGQPKGVCIEHRQMLNYLHGIQERLNISEGLNYAFVSTIAADLGNTAIFPSLCTGGSLHILSSERLVDSAAMAEYFSASNIDFLKIVPSHLKALQDIPHPERLMPRRQLILGGEPVRRRLVDQLQKYAPNCAIINHYGPTEATVGVLTFNVPQEEIDSRAATIPLGRPIANTQIYLLDSSCAPAPIWTPGHLHIGGEGVARGYLNCPDLTAEKFIPDCYTDKPGKRLYKTGDLARYLSDGNVEFLDRIDNQVKVRGFRVELREIESVIRKHPDVDEALVLQHENEQEERCLVAYVVLHRTSVNGGEPRLADSTLSSRELRLFLKDKLPDYMIPSVFMFLDTLPLTPNGKPDRKALPIPTTGINESPSIVAPSNEVEMELVRIWEDVLGVKPIGVKNRFFELGGHSLSAVRLISRIRQEFNQDVSMEALLQAETIERLAISLSRKKKSDKWTPLVPLQTHGDAPPFFCAHPSIGIAFSYTELAKYLGSDRPFYGLQSRIHDPLTSIEEMATLYIEAIHAIQPEGPYLVGGWSMGGLIAYEIARQFVMLGDSVALLALIDRAAYELDTRQVDDASLKAWFSNNIRIVKQQINQADSNGIDISPVMYQQYFQVYKNNYRAIERYVPKPYPGKIVLFVTDETAAAAAEPTLGWGALTEEVEVRKVSGTHSSVIINPDVYFLAEQLKACLNDRKKPLT